MTEGPAGPMGRLLELDHRLSTRAAAVVEHRGAKLLAGLLAHSGDSQWWLLVGALLWWLGDPTQVEIGRRAVVGTLVAALASTVVKFAVGRQRPPGETRWLYLKVDRLSFPSGHATRMGALTVVLGAIFPPWGALAVGVWALLVGASRVILAIHYTGDILVGWLLGAAVGGLLLAIVF